jgi:DNA-binding transcriptional LysR family regulator
VIGASSNIGVYLLQPLVKAFTTAQPLVGPVDIRIGSNPDTAKRLEDSEIDIGLMEWWDDRAGFEARIWRDEPVVVIVPPDHPWSRRTTVDRAALLNEPLIGGEPGTGTARLLQRELGVEPQSLKVGLQLGSTEAVKRAVRAGLGISLTLESAVRDDVEAGLLSALRIRGAPLSKPLYAILAENLPPMSLAREFETFLHPASDERRPAASR